MTEPDDRELRWPGVHRAYDFVLPSYQLLTSRFEAADSRIQSIQTFAATLILGAPLLANAIKKSVPLLSPWFLGAIGLFLVIVALGLGGRLRGTLKLPDPARLYERSLHLSEWEFKRDAVYFAGEHFQWNAEAIRVKGNYTTAMTAAFLLMIGATLIWIIAA